MEVVYALPERAWRFALELPAGATVAQALEAVRAPLLAAVPHAEIDARRLAVFGRTADLDTPLHAGDRVEILRPLLADPKQARRQRAQGRR